MSIADPNKFCVWTSTPADDHLTSCGQVIGDVAVTEHGELENCPSCDYPILESSYDYSDGD